MPRPTNLINLKCYLCGKDYKIIQWLQTQRIRHNLKKSFCSAKCKNKYQSIAHGPNWKGGRKKQGDYIMIWVAKGKHVFEHRLVMEKKLGRKLKFSEVIHHINGNRTDNRIKNLVLCKNYGRHTEKYHPRKRVKGKYQ